MFRVMCFQGAGSKKIYGEFILRLRYIVIEIILATLLCV